jgi:hypothetical protein
VYATNVTSREWRQIKASLDRKAGIYRLKHGLFFVLPKQDNPVFISFVMSSSKSVKRLIHDVLNLSRLEEHKKTCFSDTMHKCSGVNFDFLNFDPNDDWVEPISLSEYVRCDFLTPVEKYFNRNALSRSRVAPSLFNSAVVSHAMDLAILNISDFFDAYANVPATFFLEKVEIGIPYSDEIPSAVDVYKSLWDEESHFNDTESKFLEALPHFNEVSSEILEAQTNCLTNRVQEVLLEAITCIQLLALQILLEFNRQIVNLTQLFTRKTEDTFKHPPPLEYHPQIQATCAPNA